MLYNVQVRNLQNDILVDLPFGTSNESIQYLIKSIDGLGPVQASFGTSSSAGLDGVFIQSGRREARNLVFTLGYRPNYLANNNVQSLRRKAYEYFPPNQDLVIYFQDDSYETVKIYGRVESHEPKIFTEDPEVVISVMCGDPDFRYYQDVTLATFNNKALNPGYLGNAQTGFLMELFVTRELYSVRLENLVEEDIRYNGTLLVGDILKISTIRGSKYVHLDRGGVITNVLNNIVGTLDMKISPFVKSLTVHVNGSGSNNPVNITFTPRYIGI